MPNRIIKESTFTSDKIASLSDFEFRLWVGLITYVDDAGRGDARPAIIRGRLFALRERVTLKDIDDALHGLAAKGCVSLYTVGGKPYFWFPTWSEHQRIRDVKPKFPSPDEDDRQNGSAADCGGLRRIAADCGELRPESESNPNPNPNPESKSNSTRAHEVADPGLAKVMTLYMDRVQSMPSPSCVELLKGYTADLGADVVCHAIERALDDNHRSWSYIQGILRRYSAEGLTSLEAVQASEAEFERAKERGAQAIPKPTAQRKSFSEIIAERTGTK